jgi:hypothetical protein
MKLQSTAYWLMGLGLAGLTACTNPLQIASPTPSPSSASPATPQAQGGDRPRPDTRVLPINIEGQLTEIELRLFDQAPLPFTTYVPIKDFTSEVGSSEEGTGVRFYFSPKGVKDDKAYLHIFLPSQNITVEDVRNLILGDGGLLASNGWELVDRTDIVSYAWAKEKLIYQQRTPNQTFVGAIYIGEQDDKAFYAFTHYPVEYGDGFEPRSTIVLESLQFKDKK